MKLAKYGALALFSCLVFAGCSTKSTPPPCCVSFSDYVYIKYVNENGENLIKPHQPDQPHVITGAGIEIYYLINGKKKAPFKVNSYITPFHIGRRDSTGDYKMRVSPNTPSGQNIGITYITFADYPTDTLKVRYNNKHGIMVTGVWYNGELKWPNSQYKRRIITITKHPREK